MAMTQASANAGRHRGHAHDHVVQFYQQDGVLIDSVAAFVAEGLQHGEGVVAIVTEAHRQALASSLSARGIDVAAAVARGQYAILDASECLSMFMRHGLPDARLFDDVLGSLMTSKAQTHNRVRAFGEMVAVLWATGDRAAAIELEELWSGLVQKIPFSLFCAYPIAGFGDSTDAVPFERVCAQHSHVIPVAGYGGDASSAAESRALARLQQQAHALEREVAERKRVEQELRESKEELTTFVEAAAIGLHWVSKDGIVIWANPADYEMLGYARSEYVGHHISEFHSDPDVARSLMARLLAGERIRNFEAAMRCRSGALKTVLVDSSALWREGRFVHTQCFIRDVTDLKLDETIDRRLAAIVDDSDDAIISKNLLGIVTSWNRAAERIFGYEANEIVGRPISMLIPNDLHDEETRILGRLRVGESIDHYETVRRRKDGRLVEVSLTVSPIRDAQGRVVGASKIARDVTERKQLDRDLRIAQTKLARANEDLEEGVNVRTQSLREAIEQLEEFSYTVSHDMRAPLRSMRLYAEALLTDFKAFLDSQPEAKHFAERIQYNAQRLEKMVRDVLTFSRVSRDDVAEEPVRTDVFLRNLIANYPEMQAPAAEITIAEPLHAVLGNEALLNQAFSNLLTNAVKFVEPGDTPRVRIWSERVESDVRVWVEDNGIGIDPRYQHRLFRMFERLHPDRHYEGTGVGLAIVRKAVSRMKGNVGLQSDGAAGSKFWIQLPAAPDRP